MPDQYAPPRQQQMMDPHKAKLQGQQPQNPAEQEQQEKQHGHEGVIQSALDELIERPGVRFFCTAMSSIVVHVGIGCLIFLIAYGANEVPEEAKAIEIAAGLVADDTPSDATGFEFEGRNNTNNEDAEKVKDQVIDKPVGGESSSDQALALTQNPALSGTGSSDNANLAGYGAATTGANIHGIIGRGRSAGSAGGAGGGGSGSGFGRGNRPGGGEVFGVGGLPGAKSIVYVVDRSGSMDTLGDFLKTELSKAVSRLNSTQRFNVIWFSEGDSLQAFNGLVPATEDNKSRLLKNLNEVSFRGSTDPVNAMTAALSSKPELIFTLTDGNFDAELVEAITKRNTSRIKINCIGFVLPGGEGHSNLKKLAELNNGIFREIDARKLTGS